MTFSGKLSFWPIKAKLNRDVAIIGKMSPFCAVSVGDQRSKTRISLKGGREPQWNDKLDFITLGENKARIGVYNNGILLPEEEIGSRELSFQGIFSEQCIEEIVYIYYKGEIAGQLLLKLEFCPLNELVSSTLKEKTSTGLEAKDTKKLENSPHDSKLIDTHQQGLIK
ncbi:unnamed protein product [Blepharisma stoltei]|uniref:C2 domain-containing protein n=1 Tax=Blepharisma stoltei TaxID=1481888 RepID=A0AAU9IRE0_9CILI|nr:unnamed protein product [Blepharisma stoltei]